MGQQRRQPCDQAASQNILADRRPHGAAEYLRKDQDHDAGRNVLVRKDSLRRGMRLLYPDARTSTKQDLAADQSSIRRRGAPRSRHSGRAASDEPAAEDHEGRVIPRDPDADAGNEGENHGAERRRENPRPGVEGS
jgi:hypothetical protein